MVKEISEADFDEVLANASVPVMVDFWAPWCRPCRAISPIVDELAQEFAGKMEVCKVNIDDNPKLPERFSIRAIPTIIVFHKSEVRDKMTGAVSKAGLLDMVTKALG